MAFLAPLALAITPALTSLTATGVGTALSVGGAIYGGLSSQAAGKYQAQIARNNAIQAERMAEFERQKGLMDAQDQDRKNAQVAGQQRVAMGASGFDLNEGTFRDVQTSQTILGRTDSLRRKHQGDLNAWRYNSQAANFLAEADLLEAKGDNAMVAGLFNAGTSLIGGAGQFSEKWMNYKQKGLV